MPAKWIKTLLLLLLLGMPVALYLFLQGYGENQYSIPVFYIDGVPDPGPGCPEDQKPHLIDRFVKQGPCQLWNCSDIDGKFVLFSFVKTGCTTTHLEEMARVCNIYRNHSWFRAVTVPMDSDVPADTQVQLADLYGLSSDVWSWWPNHQSVASLVQCGFNLSMNCSSSEQVVLVDNLYQIRGYYEATNPQEMDRLITEIKLLLMEVNT